MKLKSVALVWLVPLVLLVLSGSFAEADEITVLREEIQRQQELLREQQRAMEQLLQRLKDLEQKQASFENTQRTLADKTADMEKAQAADRDVASQALQDVRSRFGANLSAFGDVTYSSHSREKANNSFSVADMSLYSTASYGDHLSFLVEMEVEMEDAETEVELERLWVGYTFSDLLTVRGGET